MALTIIQAEHAPVNLTRAHSGIPSGLLIITGSFTFDNSYASGGEPLPPAVIGLEEISFIVFSVVPSAGTTAQGQSISTPQYDYTNHKVWVPAGSAVAATNALMSEVKDTTDLSAFTVRFMAFGSKFDNTFIP